ncbi:hypothetical protein OIU77_001325 [Salix suchowensis]|uniref:Eukaryotic translation initiation factor 3 30 kDa subunit n=1 Tax=Salix suchowensis TaxID=1278906 RepID=A0ABQ9B181_9ROSI|nr:hypothetical protein OIU77_001325 [Salix suchowensis]
MVKRGFIFVGPTVIHSFMQPHLHRRNKAEKEANAGKKKQGGKKKQLHVDKPEDDLVVNPYDALDDYDFM